MSISSWRKLFDSNANLQDIYFDIDVERGAREIDRRDNRERLLDYLSQLLRAMVPLRVLQNVTIVLEEVSANARKEKRLNDAYVRLRHRKITVVVNDAKILLVGLV